ncbi:glycosyltransferase family 10 [uncultured Thermosynechococcus sp.]|uniref:glycosyltransferase family 10 domain-containing protein n=1 Tax=uncultured Thermosynechococcus sp. TaxID=436945 RepID=UPI00261E4A27|nr:glycosyltransferase family 10 [uncultured Thermosynechococcus sp.]
MTKRELTGLFVYPDTPTAQFFDPNASPDGLTQPWVALRERFRVQGVELVGLDEGCDEPDFELHLNVQFPHSDAPKFVILTEHPLIHPANGQKCLLQRYQTVFTWNPDITIKQAQRIQLPHPLKVTGGVDGYGERSQLVVLINSNKALAWWAPHRDLYRERVRAIRWFERYAPQDFALYGYGWDRSARQPVVGGIIHALEKRRFRRPSPPFPSWRGVAPTKAEVLRQSRFSIVYENAIFRGYVTEKIFDAFCAGNVPIYWGAPDITEYIPKACFIDRRDFSSYKSLYNFLKTMSEETYRGYQQGIWDFLHSPQAERFSIAYFVETIVCSILAQVSAIHK